MPSLCCAVGQLLVGVPEAWLPKSRRQDFDGSTSIKPGKRMQGCRTKGKNKRRKARLGVHLCKALSKGGCQGVEAGGERVLQRQHCCVHGLRPKAACMTWEGQGTRFEGGGRLRLGGQEVSGTSRCKQPVSWEWGIKCHRCHWHRQRHRHWQNQRSSGKRKSTKPEAQ
jgi:hypothetical protein